MPCRDYDNDGYIEVDRPSTVEKLCEACRIIEETGQYNKMSESLQKWWAAHKREDELRIKAEKARLDRIAKRKAILSKLTKEEKRILGL